MKAKAKRKRRKKFLQQSRTMGINDQKDSTLLKLQNKEESSCEDEEPDEAAFQMNPGSNQVTKRVFLVEQNEAIGFDNASPGLKFNSSAKMGNAVYHLESQDLDICQYE